MRHLCIIILCFGFCFSALTSQTIKEDVVRISKAYDETKKMSMNLVYKVFKNKNAAQPADVNYGYYQRNNEKYLNKIDEIESVITNDYTLYIDTSKQTITYTKTKPQQKMMRFDFTKLDELLSSYKKVEEITSANKSEKGYRIWMNEKMNEEINYYEIYFDRKTFFLQQMNLVYNKQMNFSETERPDLSSPKVEISFNNIKVNPKFNETSFLLETYLQKAGFSYKSTGKYKKYNVNVL